MCPHVLMYLSLTRLFILMHTYACTGGALYALGLIHANNGGTGVTSIAAGEGADANANGEPQPADAGKNCSV